MQDPVQSRHIMNPPRGAVRRGMDAALYNAAVKGLVEVIQLHRGSLASQITPAGNTVLHIHVGAPASKGGTTKIQFIQTVLNHQGSLLLQKNENDELPLHLAARFGHVEAVEVFLRRATERDAGLLRDMLMLTDRKKDTALHLAVRWNNVQIVELLLRADTNCQYARNDDGETPLYIAAERKHPTLVATILDACVSPDFEGPLGRTALHAAAMWGDEGMLNKILRKSNSLLKSQDDEGQTPLHYAAGVTGCSSQSLKVLLQYDDTNQSAVYIQDKEGRSALHIAALYGARDVNRIKAIIEHRPDCGEIRDNKGQNIFHYAANSGCLQTVEYLLSNGNFSKLINDKDQQGNTPLHLLATSLSYAPLSYFHCMKAFVKAEDVDLMAFNSQNKTVGDVLHSHLPCQFTPYKSEIVRYIYQVAPRDVRVPLKKIPDISQLTSYDALVDSVISDFKKSSEVHLIVATLIATVSFAAGIAVPGGFNQDLGADQGTALLARKTAFRAFMVSDALALTFSAAAILFYFHIVRLGEPQTVRRLFLIGLLATALSIGAMMVAFITATYAIVWRSPSLAAMILAFPTIFMAFYVPDFLNSVRIVAGALGMKLPRWIQKHPYRACTLAIGKACTQCG